MNEIELPDGTIIKEGGKSAKAFNAPLLFALAGAVLVGLILYYSGEEVGLIYAANIKEIGYTRFLENSGAAPSTFVTRIHDATAMKLAHAVFYGMAFFCLAYFIPALKRAGQINVPVGKGKTVTARRSIARSLFAGVLLGAFTLLTSDLNFPALQRAFAGGNIGLNSLNVFYHFGWPLLTLFSFGLLTAGRSAYLKMIAAAVAVGLAFFGLDAMYDGQEKATGLLLQMMLLIWFLLAVGFFAYRDTSRRQNTAKTEAEIMQAQATALHGDARWADLGDLGEYGMIDVPGLPFKGNFFLGDYYSEEHGQVPIHSAKDEHIITFAKARAGKGVSSIIPNLMSYEGSILVIDPKGENAAVTARHRRDNLGQKVYLLNPFKMHQEQFKKMGFEDVTHGYNPLAELWNNHDTGVTVAKQIAQILSPNKPGSRDDFWSNRSRGMIYTMLLHLIFHEEEKLCNFDRLHELLAQPADAMQKMLEDLTTSSTRAVKLAAGRVLSIKSDRTQGSIIGGAQDTLEFMDMEQMINVMCRHDFSLADLKNDKVTIYLILPVEHLETCAGWLRLMVERTLSVMSEITFVPEKPVLFLLDEAARLGRIEKLASAPAALSGFGVRVWPIFQGMGQIETLYKGNEWRDFIANSTLQVFGVNDPKTAKYFSEHLGTYGMVVETYNKGSSHNDSGMKGASAGSSSGSNLAIHKRHLKTHDEIIRMEEHAQIIVMANKRPALIAKGYYFEAPEFKDKNGNNLYDDNPYYNEDN